DGRRIPDLLEQGERPIEPSSGLVGRSRLGVAAKQLVPAGLLQGLTLGGGLLELTGGERLRLVTELHPLHELEGLGGRQLGEQRQRFLAHPRLHQKGGRTEAITLLHQPIDLGLPGTLRAREVAHALVGLAGLTHLAGTLPGEGRLVELPRPLVQQRHALEIAGTHEELHQQLPRLRALEHRTRLLRLELRAQLARGRPILLIQRRLKLLLALGEHRLRRLALGTRTALGTWPALGALTPGTAILPRPLRTALPTVAPIATGSAIVTAARPPIVAPTPALLTALITSASLRKRRLLTRHRKPGELEGPIRALRVTGGTPRAPHQGEHLPIGHGVGILRRRGRGFGGCIFRRLCSLCRGRTFGLRRALSRLGFGAALLRSLLGCGRLGRGGLRLGRGL